MLKYTTQFPMELQTIQLLLIDTFFKIVLYSYQKVTHYVSSPLIYIITMVTQFLRFQTKHFHFYLHVCVWQMLLSKATSGQFTLHRQTQKTATDTWHISDARLPMVSACFHQLCMLNLHLLGLGTSEKLHTVMW